MKIKSEWSEEKKAEKKWRAITTKVEFYIE
jgi:hypothetical protein